MKAIVVSYSNITHKYRAKAEGVTAITRSKEEGSGYTSEKIAQELAEKYDWLTFNGKTKYRLERGFLPDGDDVFVLVELPTAQPKPMKLFYKIRYLTQDGWKFLEDEYTEKNIHYYLKYWQQAVPDGNYQAIKCEVTNFDEN